MIIIENIFTHKKNTNFFVQSKYVTCKIPVSLWTDMIGRVVSSVDRGSGVWIFVGVDWSVSTTFDDADVSFRRLATNWANSSAVLALVSSEWQRLPTLLKTLGDLNLTVSNSMLLGFKIILSMESRRFSLSTFFEGFEVKGDVADVERDRLNFALTRS
jgi:hypothetical protein